MRKCIILMLFCLALSGCSKEEEPVETTPPPPPTAAHLSDTTVVLDRWGDEGLTFSVEGSEAIQSYTDVQIQILPDVNQFEFVQVDYIQGVALNDFGMAYWSGFQDETKSEYDNGFTTETECYRFIRTEKNSTLMVSGPIGLKDTVDSVYERLGGT